MTTALIRQRFATFAVKIETTPGTDVIAGTPAAADWMPGTCEINFNPNVYPDPSYTGSLDSAPSTVGGFRPTVTIRTPFRGSGAAATAPKVGDLLACCTMAVTATGSAVGAPTAAASGTTTTVTAASPFGTTADAYNGMPLLVTGDQTLTTTITDYTAGRLISVGGTYTAFTTSSLLQIPINNRYGFTSDESVSKTATIYAFHDGYRVKLTGFQGTFRLQLIAGGVGEFVFTGTAQLAADPDNTAVPSGAAAALTALPAAPRWLNNHCRINRQLARASSLVLEAGIATVLPDNPEATNGYDPAVSISRSIGGSIDPLIDTTTNTGWFATFAAGTDVPITAIIGSTAGNRMAITVPTARKLDMQMGERAGLGQFAIPFAANGPDAGAYICFF